MATKETPAAQETLPEEVPVAIVSAPKKKRSAPKKQGQLKDIQETELSAPAEQNMETQATQATQDAKVAKVTKASKTTKATKPTKATQAKKPARQSSVVQAGQIEESGEVREAEEAGEGGELMEDWNQDEYGEPEDQSAPASEWVTPFNQEVEATPNDLQIEASQDDFDALILALSNLNSRIRVAKAERDQAAKKEAIQVVRSKITAFGLSIFECFGSPVYQGGRRKKGRKASFGDRVREAVMNKQKKSKK